MFNIHYQLDGDDSCLEQIPVSTEGVRGERGARGVKGVRGVRIVREVDRCPLTPGTTITDYHH